MRLKICSVNGIFLTLFFSAEMELENFWWISWAMEKVFTSLFSFESGVNFLKFYSFTSKLDTPAYDKTLH